MIVLMILIVIAALVAVESRDLFFSLAALAAAGILAALLFYLAQAPLAAVLQLLAVPVIIYLFNKFLSPRQDTSAPAEKESLPVAVTVIFIVLALILAVLLLRSLPAGLIRPLAGQENRIIDLFGALALLATAIIGALAILREDKS